MKIEFKIRLSSGAEIVEKISPESIGLTEEEFNKIAKGEQTEKINNAFNFWCGIHVSGNYRIIKED